MARNRSSAKKAGTRFESLVTAYLREALNDERIERRAKSGAKDRGDVSGVLMRGKRVVIECKDYGGRHELPKWLREAEIERGNDDAEYGVVAWKRSGTAKPEEQYVTMTLETFAAMLCGGRDLMGD